MKKAESWLYKTLRYRFTNTDLLAQALTHRSATGPNNERLEFLGDAVLGFVISDAIFRLRPEASEGDMSRLRASLVKESSLARIATDLGLGEQLILGGGEQKSGAHRRDSILADALEAIFGAVFLDAGFPAARELVEAVFEERLASLPQSGDLRDPKSRLQEWLQGRQRGLPQYELTEVTGEAHKRRFAVTCAVDGFDKITHGEATTRRKAEQKAAAAMYVLLAGEPQ